MKSYKQILEAVNKGIQLALDDFDDEVQVQNVKSKQINHRDYTKEYTDLMEEAVDLGLPSGTLWCKYNLDVDPNHLTKAKDWYGKYYAWGELEGNKTNEDGIIYFYSDNYKFGDDYNFAKYCNNPRFGLNGFTDNLTELQPVDDVAYQTKKLHDFKFHIPTKKQCEELINYTNNYWVINYDPDKTIHNPKNDKGIRGLNGRVFEGKNGNQVFIPAAGYGGWNDGIKRVGYDCNIWSSSLDLDDSNCAYYLDINSDNSGSININHYFRLCGFSIRPVINL